MWAGIRTRILVASLGAHAASLIYRDNLQESGTAAEGSHDIAFTLYSAECGNQVLARPATRYGRWLPTAASARGRIFGATANNECTGRIDVRTRPDVRITAAQHLAIARGRAIIGIARFAALLFVVRSARRTAVSARNSPAPCRRSKNWPRNTRRCCDS